MPLSHLAGCGVAGQGGTSARRGSLCPHSFSAGGTQRLKRCLRPGPLSTKREFHLPPSPLQAAAADAATGAAEARARLARRCADALSAGHCLRHKCHVLRRSTAGSFSAPIRCNFCRDFLDSSALPTDLWESSTKCPKSSLFRPIFSPVGRKIPAAPVPGCLASSPSPGVR